MQKKINYKKHKGTYIVYDLDEKAKEYNNDDNLIFEGEYINGERNRKG